MKIINQSFDLIFHSYKKYKIPIVKYNFAIKLISRVYYFINKKLIDY